MTADGFKLETGRLLLRELRVADSNALFHLNSDPDVMRYTGEEHFTGPEQANEYIRAYQHYHEHGFGHWAVEHLETGQFMGLCGLRCRPKTGAVDLAFRLFPEYWAAGYATEAARASLLAGFEQFRLDEILGYAMRENLPSISVLQKLGMTYREMAEERGLFWLVYGIDRKDREP